MKWKWYYGLIIFVILFSIELYLDDMFISCESLKGKIVIFTHHIIAIYGVFGSFIFGYYLFHIIFTIIIISGFILFGDCLMNTYTNIVCKYNIDTPLKDFIYHISKLLDIKKNTILCIFKLSVIMYDGYMISNGYQ